MRPLGVVMCCVLALSPVLLSSCLGPLTPGDTLVGLLDQAGLEDVGPVDSQRLAGRIDSLARQIDRLGSIVPKHADVWGQARMMQHRQEFERAMKADLCCFNFSVQGAITTSDQAYLANAFGLQGSIAAASGVKPPDVTSYVSGNDIIGRNTSVLAQQTFSPLANGKLAIEPTLLEDQKRRFLDHLHELRRINEGDDNADAPGYALNLMSIPVSVLTGDCTQTGYGAECTVTATPHLTDDLLPTTFRSLVINDLVDLLGLQVTKVMEQMLDDSRAQTANEEWHYLHKLEHLRAAGGDPSEIPPEPGVNSPLSKANLDKLIRQVQPPGISRRPGKRRPISPSEVLDDLGAIRILAMALVLRPQILDHQACGQKLFYLDVQAALRQELNTAYDFLSTERNRILWDACTPGLVDGVRSQSPEFNQILISFTNNLETLTTEAPSPTDKSSPPGSETKNGGTPGSSTPGQVTTLPDPGKLPGKGTVPSNPTPGSTTTDSKSTASPSILPQEITKALAWAIVLESALLNDRFLEDMRDTQASKGCFCAPPEWVPLYLPHPPQEVCQLFNDYVRCRWPLHIFALDPETEDQNIADSYRLRREMQMAVSLAFTGGQIGASDFMRYTRRIEQDIDTISLNRTMIGFSHGDNTFGWRFYPRVQTPPVEGNFEAAFRETLLGSRGPGYLLRRRRLENGIRNCVALVIMPSFVPYVDLDVTADWFRLNHPTCKELTLKQTLRLSQEVKALQDRMALTCDQERYRPGDTELVMARLQQLSERLPLQHQLVSVPFENTHGGFEMLSTGATDLAPELVGWYGAPGINPNGETTLFLVGNNFSVLQTQVIVGGRVLDATCSTPCSSTSTQDPCDCKSASAAGADAPGKTDQAGQAAPKSSAPAAGCCAGMEAADPQVVQAGLFGAAKPPATSPAPTIANVTTVVPPSTSSAAKTTDAATSSTTTTSTTTPASPGTDSTSTKTAPSDTKSTQSPASPAPATQMATAGGGCSLCGTAGDAVRIYQVELLSRQVMRVIIPKGVYSKDGMVDVSLATPYGVSPALQIPLTCTTKPAAAPAPYALADAATVTIPYGFVASGAGYRLALIGPPQGSLRINWDSPTGTVLKVVKAVVTFDVTPAKVEVRMPLVGKNGYYEIADNDAGRSLSAFAAALLDGINQLHQFSPDKPLPASFTSSQIEITPISPVVAQPLPAVVLPPASPLPPAAGAWSKRRASHPPATPDSPSAKPLPQPMPSNPAAPPGAEPELPPPTVIPSPVVEGCPTHDVKPVKINGKITVQFQQVGVGCVAGN
ncbi:MAG: hypothetical protein JO112_05940 [Planctomycetes bacterium]|nr:hypothetical protein [Planctomycetota bacterium]